MTNPSANWTAEERLCTINAILDEEVPRGKRLFELSRDKIYDIEERIRFLASAISAQFLEANRESILKGF